MGPRAIAVGLIDALPGISLAVMRHREPERELMWSWLFCRRILGRVDSSASSSFLHDSLCIFQHTCDSFSDIYSVFYLCCFCFYTTQTLQLSYRSSSSDQRARDPTVCRNRRIQSSTCEAPAKLDDSTAIYILFSFSSASAAHLSRQQLLIKPSPCPTSASTQTANTPAPPSAARPSAECTCRCSRPMRR